MIYFNRISLLLCTLLFCAFAQTAVAQTTCEPIRILPLGDSTTQGTVDEIGYRYPLWQLITAGGYSVDFVGSQTTYRGNTPEETLTYDFNHESYWGWTIDEVLNGRGRAPIPLATHLQSYTPDITLLHLGTNDVYRNQSNTSSYDELREMIALLREDNPEIVIVLAQIVPIANDPDVAVFNAGIPALAEELGVLMVDMYTDYDYATDHFDTYHPGASGSQKMAERWFEQIESLLGRCSGTASVVDLSKLTTRSFPISSIIWGTAGSATGTIVVILGRRLKK